MFFSPLSLGWRLDPYPFVRLSNAIASAKTLSNFAAVSLTDSNSDRQIVTAVDWPTERIRGPIIEKISMAWRARSLNRSQP